MKLSYYGLFIVISIFLHVLIHYTLADVSPSPKVKTLIMLNRIEEKEKYTNFFNSLIKRRHALFFKSASDESTVLESHGKSLYKNVIIFAPGVDEFGGFEVSELEHFVNQHAGNVLIGLDKSAGHAIRQFVKRCGAKIPKKGAEVIDHFSFWENSTVNQKYNVGERDNEVDNVNPHTIVYGGKLLSNDILLMKHQRLDGTSASGKVSSMSQILFKGTHLLLNTKKKGSLLFGILRAKRTTYSADDKKEIKNIESKNTGKRIVLIGGLQARNNARIIISGSNAMFANEFSSNNQDFIASITKWNFLETGKIRVSFRKHKLEENNNSQNILLASTTEDHSVYTVTNRIKYSLMVEEYRHSNNKWIPFIGEDLQLELVLLDPVLRMNLKHDGNGRYSTIFDLPNQFGIYKLRFVYDRSPSYTIIETVDTITVRPKKLKQYSKFISLSYPYFISVVTLQIGWVFFGAKLYFYL